MCGCFRCARACRKAADAEYSTRARNPAPWRGRLPTADLVALTSAPPSWPGCRPGVAREKPAACLRRQPARAARRQRGSARGVRTRIVNGGAGRSALRRLWRASCAAPRRAPPSFSAYRCVRVAPRARARSGAHASCAAPALSRRAHAPPPLQSNGRDDEDADAPGGFAMRREGARSAARAARAAGQRKRRHRVRSLVADVSAAPGAVAVDAPRVPLITSAISLFNGAATGCVQARSRAAPEQRARAPSARSGGSGALLRCTCAHARAPHALCAGAGVVCAHAAAG
jgi:hypothetical protein